MLGLYRCDQLVVLRETKMLAILLEAGSIINRNEEILLNSPEHRALISAAAANSNTHSPADLCPKRSLYPHDQPAFSAFA
jgi:hypothetical protein